MNGVVEPVHYQIVERRGCDLEPVDATTDEGRLRLTSFVWPYQTQRHDRLRAALQIAANHPIDIDQMGAADWLAEQLSGAPEPGVLTVVWHSVTRLYWPRSETDRVERLLTDAGA